VRYDLANGKGAILKVIFIFDGKGAILKVIFIFNKFLIKKIPRLQFRDFEWNKEQLETIESSLVS
jgi:hypothetical protein